jgi:hypothetical protein
VTLQRRTSPLTSIAAPFLYTHFPSFATTKRTIYFPFSSAAAACL